MEGWRLLSSPIDFRFVEMLTVDHQATSWGWNRLENRFGSKALDTGRRLRHHEPNRGGLRARTTQTG